MNLANQLSIFRILLVPVFVGSLIYYSPDKDFLRTLSVVIFVAACLTDALDGYIARVFHQKTVIGSYLDPIADKLLLLSGFFCLSFMENLPALLHIPAWVTITVMSRDVIIFIGSAIIFITTGHLKAEPLLIGKVTTFFQMMTLVITLLAAPAELQRIFFILTTFFTIVSGVLYMRMGSKIIS